VVANVVVPTAAYVRFATHYGFRPNFCEAQDPESKGAVEALVRYAKSDLVVPAGDFRRRPRRRQWCGARLVRRGQHGHALRDRRGAQRAADGGTRRAARAAVAASDDASGRGPQGGQAGYADRVGPLQRAAHATADGRLFGFSLAMFEHVHEQQQLLRALLGRRGGAAVQSRIARLLADLVREGLLPLTAGRRPAVPIELVTTSVIGAYLALISRWVDEDEPPTGREMDEAFRRLILPGVHAAIHPTPSEP
jgi:hypothetical protein